MTSPTTSSKTTSANDSCPCGSTQPVSSCCLPLIQGKRKAETAVELMRARYSAFVRGDVDFILKTHHGKTIKDVDRKGIEDWSRNSEWMGLTVLASEAGGPKDEQGTVTFHVQYKNKGEEKTQDHREHSLFERENGEWKFLDARGVHIGTYRREEPKTGRNDACPCGSGKKFKKCCAA